VSSLFAISIFPMLCLGPVHSDQASDDWQFWQGITVPLLEKGKYQASFLQAVRFQDDMNQAYFWFVKMKNRYRLHPNLAASVNYRHVQFRNAGNSWLEEHRPEIELYPKVSFGDFTVENLYVLSWPFSFLRWATSFTLASLVKFPCSLDLPDSMKLLSQL
jgi:hypothetical protein